MDLKEAIRELNYTIDLFDDEDVIGTHNKIIDFIKDQQDQLEKANHLLIELEPNLEDEKQDEVTAYLDEYKI